MTFVAVLLIAGGCGSGGGEDPVDPLLTTIVRGGNQRGSAADQLAERLNRDDDAGKGANHALVERAVQALIAELKAHTGTERPTCGSWVDAPAYADRRLVAELVIDVAGRSGASRAIEQALESDDPYLAAWAIKAATESGLTVGDELLSRVASDDLARSVLYRSDDVTEALPPAYRTLESRAEADMTQWLWFPTELGCVPAELETMRAFDVDDGTYFVIRFKAGGGPFDDADVFLAGVSGPWSDGGELASRSHTFSDFEPAASASPEGHLRRIAGITGSID
jgi:hypothetical protein